MTGFEQSESEDADLAHTIRMRASHIPRFVGKRTMGEDEVEKLLIKQQEENDDQENEQKFLIDLLKSYDESLSESQHLSGDFNTQTDAESNSELSPFEREAKWAPRFVGKRRSPMFVGRRRAPLFIGKRYAPRFVGKRGAPMFVGRRGSPMFVGRRDSPLFVGKRENARPADTSYYVGGKRSVNAASEYQQNSASLNSLNFDMLNNDIKNKRERERLYLPQEMQIFNGHPMFSDFSKRFVVPEFVGKREGNSLPNILSQKRFDTPFFVGRRRSADIALDDLNPVLSYVVPTMQRELISNENGRT